MKSIDKKTWKAPTISDLDGKKTAGGITTLTEGNHSALSNNGSNAS